MKPYNTIEKYKRSEYLKEYNEITQIYKRQIKPLKNPFLIAFISIYTLVGTVIFACFLIYLIKKYSLADVYLSRSINYAIYASAFIVYFIPATYFIRLRQVICHKDRRLKNLEEKKSQAISGGIYDADA